MVVVTMAVSYPLCSFDDCPCFRERKCLVKVTDERLPYYVCVRVRLRGRNSVMDRGFGMTVFEKLKQHKLFPEVLNKKKGN